MDFLGMGPLEVLVVLLVAFLVLGPTKMVEAARGMGRFFRQVRRATQDVPQLLSLDEPEGPQARGSEAHRVKQEGASPTSQDGDEAQRSG